MFEPEDLEIKKPVADRFSNNEGSKKDDAAKKRKQKKALRTLEEERLYRGGVTTVKDLIAPSSIEVQPTFLRLNGQYIRTIFVITYPRYITVGWFAPIINLNYTLDISMFFYPMNPEIILKQLKIYLRNNIKSQQFF